MNNIKHPNVSDKEPSIPASYVNRARAAIATIATALPMAGCSVEAIEEPMPCVGITYEVAPDIREDLRVNRITLTDGGYRKYEENIPIEEEPGGFYTTCFKPGNERFDFALPPYNAEAYKVEMAVLPLQGPIFEGGIPRAAESAYHERYFLSFDMKEANYIYVRIKASE